MKQVIFTALVVIVLGVVWTLYLQWDNKRFVESLPKSVSQMNIEEPTDMSTPDSWSENENTEHPAPAAANLFEEIPPDTAHRPPHGGNPHSHNSVPTFRIEQELKNPDQLEKEEGLEQGKESNLPVSFMDLSLEQIIENNRQSLINRHGNIPEIDIYLKLNEPFFRALLKGKPTRVVIERTPEESLESSRVTAILFPNEANKKAYQDELEKMKELGLIK